MNLVQEIHDELATFTAWRRELHKHPETAFDEHRTSAFVADTLESFGMTVHRGVTQTGVVGVLTNGTGKKAVGLRADMDAIFGSEGNDFEYCSQVPGKMHGCGHDGHMVMLLAAAKHLAATRNFDGTIYFIFQPAEENEAGGRVMVEDGLFERFPMDAIYGMHNWPGLPAGEFAVSPGPIMAGNDHFEIRVIGKSCHAAMPHLGIDPIPIAADVVSAIQTITRNRVSAHDPVVISITQFHAGTTWNVIPDDAVIRGTVRALDRGVQREVEQAIRERAEKISSAHGATVEVSYDNCYLPTINHKANSKISQRIVEDIVGPEHVHTDIPPSMGAEDFAFMLNACPGCYIWLGAGKPDKQMVLHNQHYDFNDEVIPIGATYWIRLAEDELSV